MTVRPWLLTLFVCPLLLVSAASAQTAAAIAGLVQDESGGVLKGATVTVRQTDTGLLRLAETDDGGRFVVPNLNPGRYQLRIERANFRPYLQSDLDLSIGETLAVNVTLRVGPVEEAVTVVGRSTQVNTTSSDLSYLVEGAELRDLPLNGRSYTDLAFLQPGVIAYPHRDGGSVVAAGVGMSVNGQDPRTNVYLLDGTPQNNFTNGPAGSAAGTALGMETIREFRVEVNAYSAEFGRNAGGQVNVLTKSGSNDLHGSLYHYLRNDNFDARNFFDQRIPEFKRNQFGGAAGGPIRRDKTFFFVGYESLREQLGRTINSIVPDEQARQGILPGVAPIAVDPIIRPYLDEFPLPNGPNLGGGTASYLYGFNQTIDQTYVQGRLDHRFNTSNDLFARYTFDDADQRLPMDFPQFPRNFISKNQFATVEWKRILSASTFATFRGGFSRTRTGQNVEANLSRPLTPFVPGRPYLGNIDITGIPRFGPQSSSNLRLTQNIFTFEPQVTHIRGRHTLKFGGLIERYRNNMVNPTFSLGIYSFASLADFLRNRPLRFVGLTPQGALDRYWRSTLFGAYLQDDFRIHPRLTVNLGLRYEFMTMPVDLYGRDSALINLSDPAPTVGQLYQNPTKENFSPRIGAAWDLFGDGSTSLRGGYGLFFVTNNIQHLIVTVTNPPATPRIIINNPTFPVPPFERGIGNSIRPVQWDLRNPRVHQWNLNLQRQLPANTVVTVGYAGARGRFLLRNYDANIPQPQRLADGTLFWPTGQTRPNPNFGTVEIKASDGDSWYNALIIDARKRFGRGFSVQSSYTLSRNIDTGQGAVFFSDSTNGTISALPEFPQFGLNYNKGLTDFHAKHNWVGNFLWGLPLGTGRLRAGWQLAGIMQVRSGNPLTVFVARNRSRSQWNPSIGPNQGLDRPSLAPGYTHESAVLGRPDQWFDPRAFVLQPAGTLGNLGRGALIGPDLRTFDLALSKSTKLTERFGLQLRVEAFNLLNRANFGIPLLQGFEGAVDNEAPRATFGRIRNSVTSSRQIQLGLRISF